MINLSKYFNKCEEEYAKAMSTEVVQQIIDKISRIKPEDSDGNKFTVSVSNITFSPNSGNYDYLTLNLNVSLKQDVAEKATR